MTNNIHSANKINKKYKERESMMRRSSKSSEDVLPVLIYLNSLYRISVFF